MCVCVCVCGGGDPQLTVLVIRTQKFWSELVRKQAAGLPKRLGRREPDRTGSSSATWRRHSGCGGDGSHPLRFFEGAQGGQASFFAEDEVRFRPLDLEWRAASALSLAHPRPCSWAEARREGL